MLFYLESHATYFCLSSLLSFTWILESPAACAVIILDFYNKEELFIFSTNTVAAEEVP